MRELLIILAIVTGLAYLSQRQSMKMTNGDGRKHWDIYLIILLVFLILFAGLRTSYNDTENYIVGFNTSVGIGEFLSNPDNLQPLENPLFYGFGSFKEDVQFRGYPPENVSPGIYCSCQKIWSFSLRCLVVLVIDISPQLWYCWHCRAV